MKGQLYCNKNVVLFNPPTVQIMVLAICRDTFLPLGGDIDVTNPTKFGKKVLFDLHGFTVSMQI